MEFLVFNGSKLISGYEILLEKDEKYLKQWFKTFAGILHFWVKVYKITFTKVGFYRKNGKEIYVKKEGIKIKFSLKKESNYSFMGYYINRYGKNGINISKT
jgi:hypothetical protein